MKVITHVVFDVDGLLLDTESIYTAATTELLSSYGKTFDYSVKRKAMGRKPLDACAVIVKELNLPIDASTWHDQFYSKLTEQRWNSAQKMPGSQRLIKHLFKQKIPMALATGCCKAQLLQKMKNHEDIWTCFQHFVASGDDPEVCI